MPDPTDALTPEDGKRLLELARRSVERFVRTGGREPLPEDGPPVFEQGLGAFVTLHTRGHELRGCIGTLAAHGPLVETIREMAIAACSTDPRFSKVTEDELDDLVIDISVLTPLVETRAEDVVPGKHGVFVRKGYRSGVLLPQVATEHGWDRETFLRHTCRKAGLAENAWSEPDATLYTFEAQVFSE